MNMNDLYHQACLMNTLYIVNIFITFDVNEYQLYSLCN